MVSMHKQAHRQICTRINSNGHNKQQFYNLFTPQVDTKSCGSTAKCQPKKRFYKIELLNSPSSLLLLLIEIGIKKLTRPKAYIELNAGAKLMGQINIAQGKKRQYLQQLGRTKQFHKRAMEEIKKPFTIPFPISQH